MKEGLIDYFPINRALVLKHSTSDDEELKSMMKVMVDRFGSLQVKIFMTKT